MTEPSFGETRSHHLQCDLEGLNKRIADKEVTDLPEPDSPNTNRFTSVKRKAYIVHSSNYFSSVWNSVTKFLNSNKVLLIFSGKLAVKNRSSTRIMQPLYCCLK